MKKNLILIFLFLICVGLIGYLVYDKVIEKNLAQEEKENTVIEEKNELLELTDNLVINTLKSFQQVENKVCTIADYYFQDKKVNFYDLPLNFVFLTAISFLEDQQEGLSLTNVSRSNLDEVVDRLFSTNYPFVHQSFQACKDYTYEGTTGMYQFDSDLCSLSCSDTSIYRLVKAEKQNNNLILWFRVLFAPLKSSAREQQDVYYQDANRTKALPSLTYENSVPVLNDENFAQGSLYKMTFVLEDNNYTFRSSELAS